MAMPRLLHSLCRTVVKDMQLTYNVEAHVRSKHQGAYFRRKTNLKIGTAFANPKSWRPPKQFRKQQEDISIVGSTTSKLHPNVVNKLRLLGNEYKYDILSILHSGCFDSETAALAISKVELSYNGNEMLIFWRQTLDEERGIAMETKLESLVHDIQLRFDQLHPSVNLPKVSFQREKHIYSETLEKIKELDLPECSDENSDNVGMSRRLPPITFVDDVYGLQRNAIISKISSVSKNITSFGADEQSAFNEDNINSY